ncbi:hypothetical protein KFK09_025241 [Dendrobium nobile]|uniref:DUF4283 domain-containing protein n=1 Tax=Dendrobium nobile TaxID=94219 RepID=A0A8T3AGB5_DENNO|nr:hypothetical protein KFK09_025241 [Dendrobium nobile]
MANSVKRLDPGFLDSKNRSKSFKEVLSGSDASKAFSDMQVTTIRGLMALWISEFEVLHLAKPFDFALVGKFPLRRPALDSIRRFFSTSNYRVFFVTLLDHSNVLIKLCNDLDYGRIVTHRSYFVFGCFIKVIKWTPFLDLSKESPIVYVWISFLELHPHLFSPRILFGLGSLFGRPLHTDNTTVVGSRSSVAHILVEMNISKTYPDSIWLGPEKLGYIQKVVLEGFPSYCPHCKSVGHKKSECVKLFPHLRQAVASVQPPMVSELVPVVNPPSLDLIDPSVPVNFLAPTYAVSAPIVAELAPVPASLNVCVRVGASSAPNTYRMENADAANALSPVGVVVGSVADCLGVNVVTLDYVIAFSDSVLVVKEYAPFVAFSDPPENVCCNEVNENFSENYCGLNLIASHSCEVVVADSGDLSDEVASGVGFISGEDLPGFPS